MKKKDLLSECRKQVKKRFSIIYVGFNRGEKIIHHISGGGLRRFDAKPVWICRTFNLKGKALCASRQIPEDILLPIVQEVYDSGVEVDRILVQPGNVLEFILANGNVITRTWKDHSRRESWTPEKREQARQKMMRYHNKRRACANE